MPQFNPKKLPKGFPDDGILTQHGKPYITHVGLVWLANHQGKPWNGTIVEHDIRYDQNGEPLSAMVVYRVWDDEREHTDIGDATRRNVGKMIVPHLIRMASTRAQNRALRAFVGYAGCTADELALGDTYSGSESESYTETPSTPQNGARGPSQPRSDRSPSMDIRTNSPYRCPACGGALWDNREKAIPARAQGKKMPYFSCSRKSACPGGKGDFGWGEWDDPNRFDAEAPESSGRDDGPPPYTDDDLPF